MTRRFALAVLVAWLVLAALILGRYTDEAMPPHYLLRPLLVALAVSVLIAGVALLARSWAVPLAAGLALVLALAELQTVLTLLAVVILLELLRRRGRMPRDIEPLTLLFAGIFFAIGMIMAIGATQWPSEEGYEAATGGPPMYVFLLDGYPRIDTLRDLGFNNEPFGNALAQRGFDNYPESHSEHTRTHKTLVGLLTDLSVNSDPVSVTVRREIRRLIVVPPGFVEIDPPVAFVTMGSGPHVTTQGPTDFEADLVGKSIVGTLLPDWAWNTLLGALRDNVDAELEAAATTDAPRVFTHVMAPHPPFLAPWDGATSVPRRCWPSCGIFAPSFDDMGLTREEWAGGMAAQVAALNEKLLDTVDRILDQHPDAVIVLFSDHGGRADWADEAELHRSFLAARTPGHPDLYADDPKAEDVIRTLLGAYGSN